MTTARLRVTVPDGVWKGDVSRGRPGTRIRIRQSVLDDDDAVVELVVVTGPDAATCLAEIECHPDVSEVAVFGRTEDGATVQVRSSAAPILRAGRESVVPIETPFDVVGGEATLGVTSTHDGLSALGDRFRDRDLPFEVASVQPEPEYRELLTRTQRELLLAAVEEGYYETPRRCTLTELAESVGIAKSTCSDTLKRAEEAVVDYFLQHAGVSVRERDREHATPRKPGDASPSRRVVGESAAE